MPSVNDFREDEFYVMNFTPAEISYAILQPDPLATFAGLFAAKEAIVKSDNTIKNKAFNSIFIDHLPSGKPIYPGFSISISHTPTLAMASAVKLISPKTSTQVISQETPSGNNNYLVYLLFFLTGILSAGLIFLLFFKK
jgi:phosphopantetheinyl transferase (holo-ACP synthase)